MKILLITNQPYTFWYVGANRSNRSVMEELVRRGHQGQVVAPAFATPSSVSQEQLVEELVRDGVEVQVQEKVNRFIFQGVEVHAVREQAELRGYLTDRLSVFKP